MALICITGGFEWRKKQICRSSWDHKIINENCFSCIVHTQQSTLFFLRANRPLVPQTINDSVDQFMCFSPNEWKLLSSDDPIQWIAKLTRNCILSIFISLLSTASPGWLRVCVNLIDENPLSVETSREQQQEEDNSNKTESCWTRFSPAERSPCFHDGWPVWSSVLLNSVVVIVSTSSTAHVNSFTLNHLLSQSVLYKKLSSLFFFFFLINVRMEAAQLDFVICA